MIRPLVSGALALLLLSGPATAETDTAPTWLSGCWASESGRSVEAWSAFTGGYAFAHAISVGADGQVRFFEHLRIEPAARGRLRYAAYPKGEGPVFFEEAGRSARSITFENPNHDHPQRIAYGLEDGVLTATASALDGSKAAVFKKTRCP